MTSSGSPCSPPASTGRFSALTMPLVTVPASPSGDPTATTGVADPSSSELPSDAGCRSRTPLTLMTARSLTVSGCPTIVARLCVWSGRMTDSVLPDPLAAATTWLLVRM